MIGWKFDINRDNTYQGINDSGIEFFSGSGVYEQLAREICQNSYDAKLDNDKPAVVEFSNTHIPSHEFPNKAEYKSILQKAYDYWKSRSSSYQELEFLKNALDMIDKRVIDVLKVSDYNTTGLRGSFEEEATSSSNWAELVKGTGSSNKGETQGGSFGIGKSAPFACSGLRTIIYSTYDDEGFFAYQGVARLVSHKDDQGKIAKGTLFYGEDNFKPVHEQIKINKKLIRTEKTTGTDICILGFESENSWKEEIIKSVIKNFFVAVLENKIKVIVEGVEINADTISTLLDEYYDKGMDLTREYFDAYKNGEKRETKILDLDEVELRVIKNKTYSNRVARFRENGMMIYERKQSGVYFGFAAVFIARGPKINKYLRKLEPPSHDKWDKTRPRDHKDSEKYYTEILKWISEIITEMNPAKNLDFIDPDGCSDYLPDDSDMIEDEDFSGNNEKVTVQKVETKTKERTNSYIVDPDEETGYDEEDSHGSHDGESVEKGGKSFGGNGDSPTSGRDWGGNSHKYKGLSLDKTIKTGKLFCISEPIGLYKLIVMPSATHENVYLRIKAVGESNNENVKVIKAKQGNREIKVNDDNGYVGPLYIYENEKMELMISLAEREKMALQYYLYKGEPA